MMIDVTLQQLDAPLDSRTRHVIFGGFDVALGLALAVAPPARFSNPNYAGPELVGAAVCEHRPMLVWGLLLLFAGVGILWRPRTASAHAFLAAALWFGFWSGCLAASLLLEPQASPSAPLAHAFLCVLHLAIALQTGRLLRAPWRRR